MTDPQEMQAPKPGDWSSYYDAVAGLPARETCVRALDAFEREDAAMGSRWRTAIDIACGEGRDTREIISRKGPTRWNVVAHDDESGEGMNRLMASLSESDRPRVRGALARLEDLPRLYATGVPVANGRLVQTVDLVNASFSIPHCRPDVFPLLWEWIVGLIHPGGRFAGQFFGVRDSWATKPDGITRTYHTRAQVEEMLRTFEVEHLEEIERPGKNALGEPKYWHVFHVVAQADHGLMLGYKATKGSGR